MALAAFLVAGLAARDAAVLATASRYPQLAAKLAPANATAIVHVFDDTVMSSGDLRRDFKGWIAASRQALRADPLNASALRLLAYVTELLPDGQPSARRLMMLSERASRRDVLAQVWLIEDAVRRGDVEGALHHYDRALTVRPGMAGTLIPILVSATSTPEIRAALVPYLRADRAWTHPFLSVAVGKGQDLAAVADLFRRYGGARAVPTHSEYETRLLARLVNEGDLATARSFAGTMGMSAAARALGFSAASTAPRFRPLTWTLYDGVDGAAELAAGDGLAVTVAPEKRIVAASRMIAPAQAHLILRQRFTLPDPSAAPLITWQAYCRRIDGPQRFWTRDLPAVTANEIVQMPLDVPEGCVGIQLDLLMTGTIGTSDAKALIDRVDLVAR
ncbi:hypothetical protein [Sphingomonas sp. BK235]|uniref:hypothetical protein n=1 Tax=Sphingomonas sp. BK235 TaxID=2512131 RepID=UPI0010E7D369|nr:hypothetical protein [Sphingomonas sp. BK235]TCP29369.1 hypothetical protein EV292_11813 [Sphingomonas sp. BK235]